MMSEFLKLIFVFCLLIGGAACFNDKGSTQSKRRMDSNLPHDGTRNESARMMETLAGVWSVYKGDSLNESDYCAEGVPCGRKVPDVTLEYKDDKLSGTQLQGFDSRKQRGIFGTIAGCTEDGKIILRIFEGELLIRTYSLRLVDENSLSGEYLEASESPYAPTTGRALFVRQR